MVPINGIGGGAMGYPPSPAPGMHHLHPHNGGGGYYGAASSSLSSAAASGSAGSMVHGFMSSRALLLSAGTAGGGIGGARMITPMPGVHPYYTTAAVAGVNSHYASASGSSAEDPGVSTPASHSLMMQQQHQLHHQGDIAGDSYHLSSPLSLSTTSTSHHPGLTTGGATFTSARHHRLSIVADGSSNGSISHGGTSSLAGSEIGRVTGGKEGLGADGTEANAEFERGTATTTTTTTSVVMQPAPQQRGRGHSIGEPGSARAIPTSPLPAGLRGGGAGASEGGGGFSASRSGSSLGAVNAFGRPVVGRSESATSHGNSPPDTGNTAAGEDKQEEPSSQSSQPQQALVTRAIKSDGAVVSVTSPAGHATIEVASDDAQELVPQPAPSPAKAAPSTSNVLAAAGGASSRRLPTSATPSTGAATTTGGFSSTSGFSPGNGASTRQLLAMGLQASTGSAASPDGATASAAAPAAPASAKVLKGAGSPGGGQLPFGTSHRRSPVLHQQQEGAAAVAGGNNNSSSNEGSTGSATGGAAPGSRMRSRSRSDSSSPTASGADGFVNLPPESDAFRKVVELRERSATANRLWKLEGMGGGGEEGAVGGGGQQPAVTTTISTIGSSIAATASSIVASLTPRSMPGRSHSRPPSGNVVKTAGGAGVAAGSVSSSGASGHASSSSSSTATLVSAASGAHGSSIAASATSVHVEGMSSQQTPSGAANSHDNSTLPTSASSTTTINSYSTEFSVKPRGGSLGRTLASPFKQIKKAATNNAGAPAAAASATAQQAPSAEGSKPADGHAPPFR